MGYSQDTIRIQLWLSCEDTIRIQSGIQSGYNQNTVQNTIRIQVWLSSQDTIGIQNRIQLGYNQDTDQDTSIGQSIRNRSESNQNTDGIHSGYKSEGGIRLYPDALAEFERTKEAPFGFLEVFWVFATHFELFDLGVCECHH